MRRGDKMNINNINHIAAVAIAIIVVAVIITLTILLVDNTGTNATYVKAHGGGAPAPCAPPPWGRPPP